jgi:MscS family membrane protein
LQHKEIENFTAALNEIASNAFIINGDYFTRPLTNAEFIKVKEEINLAVLKLMEEMEIEIAGANIGVRIESSPNVKPDLSS